MTELVQAILNGVVSGTTYGLIGVAITLGYGLSRVVNFSVGQMMMLSAFAGYAVADASGNYLLALVAGVVTAALLGAVLDRAVFRFTYDQPLTGFIVSLGITLILQAVIIEIWSAETQVGEPVLKGVTALGDLVLRTQDIANVAVSWAAVAGMYLLLHRTRLGAATRAVADDRRAALLMGVPVTRVILLTAVGAAALLGVAGWGILTTSSISASVASTYLLRGFAVALVGGLGSVEGALAAGLGIGIAENLVVTYGDPAWSQVYLFGIVIAILLWRPRGLAGGLSGAHL